MTIYEDENFMVKNSEIEGCGLFAKRSFKEGETILKWNPKILSQSEIDNISELDKRYINTLDDGTRVLMSIPERFVNHSDSPNTRPERGSDIAIRDIGAGEEITSSYDFELKI